MANILWSLSTTIRNPERIPSFFKTLVELEGEEWSNANQERFQILLIKNRIYKPTDKNLTAHQIDILNNLLYEMSEDEARDIFDAKEYKDPPMRGRTSFDPLEKIGLVSLIDNKVTITPVGKKYLNSEIEFGDVFFNALIKQQYPYPLSNDNKEGYNVKPFIAVLHLIKKVNEKWEELGNEPVGISREEFGIFCLNIKQYTDIELIAKQLISFRLKVKSITLDQERKEYIEHYTFDYLSEFENLEKKLYDYRDNMIRALRLTKLIYIRGNGYYIDLEPRRKVELTKLLESDDGSARQFSEKEWIEFIGSPTSYTLPWETPESLHQIQFNIISDIRRLEDYLEIEYKHFEIFTDLESANNNIFELRKYRSQLENDKNKILYSELDKALQIVDAYDVKKIKNNEINKPSVELERVTTLALNIIGDAKLIKPNYPVGDDNEPTFTAPGNVPDIECFYENFNIVCEVTLLTGRNQWVSEGQPVMRHFRDFENSNTKIDNYCLFIAPNIHQDTLSTFWNSVKYGYDGKQQKILPITISQVQTILKKSLEVKEVGKETTNEQFQELFEICTNVTEINGFSEWKSLINRGIDNWINSL
jgi:hypothetical protein